MLLSDDRIRANGGETTYKFSKIVTLSDSKKCLLRKTVSKNKNHEGGKVMGAEMLYIYNYHNEKWSLSDKKVVAMY